MTIVSVKYEIQYAFEQNKDQVYFNNMVIKLLEMMQKEVRHAAAEIAIGSESKDAAHRYIMNLQLLK